MSESPGPGGDAENANELKNNRHRSAEDDSGLEVVPTKMKKLEDPSFAAEGEDEDGPLEDDFEDEETGQEEEDFAEEDEGEEGDYEEDGLEENALGDTGESSDLEEFIQTNLADIEVCQSDIETLNKDANDEILKVEQKYNKLRQPVYAKRNTYIDKIPCFWATVFSNHPQLKRVLSKEDIKCLNHLTNLQIDDFEDSRSGYRIKFSFSNNPWFSNSLITKEYHLPWNDSPSCMCTSIDWYPGMNLTKKRSSFFSWFCSQEDASTDDIAEIIKEELWPNPLQTYLLKENGAVDSNESEEDDEEAVYVEGDEDDEPEYISSEDEEGWNQYRRPPAFGKEAPGSSRGRQYAAEDEPDNTDYGDDLEDVDSRSQDIDEIPDDEDEEDEDVDSTYEDDEESTSDPSSLKNKHNTASLRTNHNTSGDDVVHSDDVQRNPSTSTLKGSSDEVLTASEADT